MSAVLSLLILALVGPPDVGSADAGAGVPASTLGAPAQGSLDKEVIRGIIRRHLNEVKYCYERGLTAKPDLFGQIMVRFVISAWVALSAVAPCARQPGNAGTRAMNA